MTSTFPIYWPRYCITILLAIFSAMSLLFINYRQESRSAIDAPSDGCQTVPSLRSDWPETFSSTSMGWGIFVPSFFVDDAKIGDATPPQFPYRLAGTFFNEDEKGRQTRQAVLDDTRKRDQRIVSEGEEWDDIRVESIFVDHIIVTRSGVRAEIWLRLMTNSPDSSAPQSDGGVTNAVVTSEVAIATNRFGSQVTEYRWVFKRNALMDYTRSVAEDSIRMAQLFDSLKPIYDERKRIHGYELESQGETDFFRDVGLKEGDQVQKVNGMPMSNRRRAEFFISEFTNNRMNVFVLDIERNGQAQKLIYQLQ